MLTVEAGCNLLYTLSIWNLGKYFGVMTDKGLRTTGFYSIVRHPSYTLEALMFLCLALRGLSGWQNVCAALAVYVVLYYVRSEREDQFMGISNPGYVEYRQRTPWKFIPGVF